MENFFSNNSVQLPDFFFFFVLEQIYSLNTSNSLWHLYIQKENIIIKFKQA